MFLYSLSKKYFVVKRKVKLSPPNYVLFKNQRIRAFFFAPLRAALTVETALVLPLFLFVMIAALQYANVMGTAAKFGTALAETGKNMAAAAYVSGYGGEIEGGTELAVYALSAAYAQQKVLAKAGKPSDVKNENMLLSSFLQEEDNIDLVLTYQMKTPIAGVRLPGNFFLQRAVVRAWTGRKNGTEHTQEETEAEHDYVYVTETGSVYHKDMECTHLKLSVREIDREALDSLRNFGGAKYYACEKCGAGDGGSVYITNEGNRYHSSLSCSGLKRTVREVDREECGLPPCSRCGG